MTKSKKRSQKSKKSIRKRTKKSTSIVESLRKSPINYFSDLFIVAMVVLWITDIIYQSIIATIVTVSSIVLSFVTGTPSYDTSMWASIGGSVAVPLSCGGTIWMIKNSVQHAIAYSKGKRAHQDFPAVTDVSNEEIAEVEKQVEFDTYTDEEVSPEDFKSNEAVTESVPVEEISVG